MIAWPLTRWLMRRPEPLDGADGAPSSRLQRSQAHAAIREFADTASVGLDGPWRDAVRQASAGRSDDIVPLLDRAVSTAGVATIQTPAWWYMSRAEQDEFACRSQNLAEQRIAEGFWARDITPVTLPDGSQATTDDGPRAGTTLEALSGLKPVFRPDGTVTAGNACPLNDGAAAVVIMHDSAPVTVSKPAIISRNAMLSCSI